MSNKEETPSSLSLDALLGLGIDEERPASDDPGDSQDAERQEAAQHHALLCSLLGIAPDNSDGQHDMQRPEAVAPAAVAPAAVAPAAAAPEAVAPVSPAFDSFLSRSAAMPSEKSQKSDDLSLSSLLGVSPVDAPAPQPVHSAPPVVVPPAPSKPPLMRSRYADARAFRPGASSKVGTEPVAKPAPEPASKTPDIGEPKPQKRASQPLAPAVCTTPNPGPTAARNNGGAAELQENKKSDNTASPVRAAAPQAAKPEKDVKPDLKPKPQIKRDLPEQAAAVTKAKGAPEPNGQSTPQPRASRDAGRDAGRASRDAGRASRDAGRASRDAGRDAGRASRDAGHKIAATFNGGIKPEGSAPSNLRPVAAFPVKDDHQKTSVSPDEARPAAKAISELSAVAAPPAASARPTSKPTVQRAQLPSPARPAMWELPRVAEKPAEVVTPTVRPPESEQAESTTPKSTTPKSTTPKSTTPKSTPWFILCVVLFVLAAACIVYAAYIGQSGWGATDSAASAAGAADAPAVYRYSVEKPDGTRYTVNERITLNDQGFVTLSAVTIEADSKADAEAVLDDVRAQFGPAWVGGLVDGSNAVFSVKVQNKDINAAVYEELLRENTIDFQVVNGADES